MKRVIIGIFAHPDDEAFGPSGTLLRLNDQGYDIHLILLTNGEAGTNPGVLDLSSVRQEEWSRAATLLDATSTCQLNLPDGKVREVPSTELDERLITEMKRIINSYSEPVSLSFMTFEPMGLTGHRDHVAASEATARLFENMKADTNEELTVDALWYYCLCKEQAPLTDTPYYYPQARSDEYITTRIDVSSVLNRKYAVIDCHATQVVDAANLKALGDDTLSTECFYVISAEPIDLES